jgi:hypothetical protein
MVNKPLSEKKSLHDLESLDTLLTESFVVQTASTPIEFRPGHERLHLLFLYEKAFVPVVITKI